MKRAWWIPLLLIVVAGPAAAETRWYDVELIVFERVQGAATTSERWRPRGNERGTEEALELVPVSPTLTPFQRLPEDNHRLRTAAERLESSPNFRVLVHTAWRQPGLASDEARAVRITTAVHSAAPRESFPDMSRVAAGALASAIEQESGAVFGDGGLAPAAVATPEPTLEGTVRVVLSRFLHLETDLSYRLPRETVDPELELMTVQEDIYRLRESRRMRSRELHYLDHPVIGVIAQITPYEAPPAR